MKCFKQPAFLANKSTPITELWEVRMPQQLWSVLQTLARQAGVTYSTITRLCVFHLSERSHARIRLKLRELDEKDKKEYRQDRHHRHIVCLYGEDARLLRLASLQMGISVSRLIRLALRLYIRRVAMVFHNNSSRFQRLVFWKGIKRWIAIPLIATNQLSLPDIRRLFLHSFPPALRWGWPEDDVIEKAC